MRKRRLNTYLKRSFITLAFLLSFTRILYAQSDKSDCKMVLSLANKEYDAGHFSSCIDMLKTCIDGLDNENKFEAYRLISLSYLGLNDEKKATEASIRLLKLKPDYLDFPYFDPKEFTRMINKYEVWPRAEVGLMVGLNLNNVHLSKNYSVSNSPSRYVPRLGYQTGLTFEYFLKKQWSLNTGLLIERLDYSRESSNVLGWNQNFKEKMRFIGVPMVAKYYFYNKNRLRIAAELGAQIHLLNSTNSYIILNNIETSESFEGSLNQSDQRNKTLYYGLAGISLKYKTGDGYLCANIRYGYGLNNVVKSDARYNNMDFILTNMYIDSDFKFTPYYFNFGYQLSIPRWNVVRLRK